MARSSNKAGKAPSAATPSSKPPATSSKPAAQSSKPPNPAHVISDDDYDPDPVVNEFSVYLKPSPSDTSSTSAHTSKEHLYLFQFPTRDRKDAYNKDNADRGGVPLSLRVKPETGFVELDIPIATSFNYDHAKGKKWADALKKTGGGEGLGLAGGFMGKRSLGGIGGRRGVKREDGTEMDVDDKPNQGVEEMKKQTLGGMVVTGREGDDNGPAYMFGVFRGAELHLSPLTGLVQLRPQFPHLDAVSQLARYGHSPTAVLESNGNGPASTPARPAPRPSAPRAITTQIRATDDPYAATRALIHAAADEGWTHLDWKDEETDEAYDAFRGQLFLNADGEGGVAKLVGKLGKEEYLEKLCEGLGGAEKGSKKARLRNKKRTEARPKWKSGAVVVEDGGSDTLDNDEAGQ